MSTTASYLLSSTGIRFKQNGRYEIRWIQNVKPARGGLNPKIIKERAEEVFQLIPQNQIKNLVIVNGNLSDFEMIQACVEVAEKYTNNILVIPPLLARITYALDNIAKMHDPPPEEVILIVTVTHAFVDFVILQRDQNFELNIVHREIYKNTNASMTEFSRFYEHYCPDATVVLVHKDFFQIFDGIQREFEPRNLFMRHYNRWDHLLVFGAFAWASDDAADFDYRYRIPNFTMGIETIIPGRGTGCNFVIHPERTRIPCKIYGFEGRPQPLTLCYFPEYYLFFDKLTLERKDASKKCVWITGSANQVIGYFDKRGVPYITATKDRQEEIKKEPTKMIEIKQSPERPINFPSASTSVASESMPSQIKFIFEDEFCAVEIYQNNLTQKVKNSAGNEWTPIYLSMAEGAPVLGEKAKSDYQKSPECVIYDVLKIIGKPFDEITVDPKWGFKLVEDDDEIVYFEIETPSGGARFTQELVVSAFLKSMKLQAESNMGTQINEICLSTNFKLIKSQKALFEKAAAKNSLRILTKDARGFKLIGLPSGPPAKGWLTPAKLKQRAELVFQLVPERMKNLVIVNSALSDFEMIQACVKVAEKYADNIMVIPPLLALLTYAVEDLAEFHNPPKNEVILVVTVTCKFVDIAILRRDKNFQLYVSNIEHFKQDQCEEMFLQFYEDFRPNATVFLVQDMLFPQVDEIRHRYNPIHCFIKKFKKWDYVLLFGGLLRSMDDEDGFDTRYHIENFSNGYEASIQNPRTRNLERHILLPEQTPLPCNIYGFDGIPQSIKIHYFADYYQVNDELVLRKREATKYRVYASGSSRNVIGCVDERGVPYAPVPKNTVDARQAEPNKVVERTIPEPIRDDRINSVLIIDLSTGNMLDFNPRTGSKALEENAFDRNLPSSSSSNPYQALYNVLQDKSFDALHIITAHEILNEGKDLFHSICNNVSYTSHIKAQLSFCFKKLKNEENLEKFAVIYASQNHLMDLLLFEYRSQQYYFIQRVQDLTVEDVEMKIKSEYVKDIFMFRPRGVQLLLDIPDEDITVNVFEIRDYKNMALNGIVDMDENLKDLANTKDLKALFDVQGSFGRTTRSASDAGIFSQSSSPSVDHSLKKSVPLPPEIMFLFRDNAFAVEIFRDGFAEILTGGTGIEWTPLYLSMANGAPVLGEKAKSDYRKSPKCVIYDVLKIIGKPLDEISVDLKWGFKMVKDDDEILYFEIETPSGGARFTQELVVSAFLK
uniref:Uncharacterized protein n=1 Tax=Panagrolaimus sp. ES5 TaxID=591445 RepID=A0AC34FQ25_9BILA